VTVIVDDPVVGFGLNDAPAPVVGQIEQREG